MEQSKIIIKWKSSFLGAACKFDVYLMNMYIGELKCGGTLETPVDVGTHTLFFKEKKKFGKKADTAFEVVVNEKEIVELRTKFNINGNFVVNYADNAPHIPMYSSSVAQSNIINNESIISQNVQKKKNGFVVRYLTVIFIIIAILLIVAINNDNSIDKVTTQTEQTKQTENILYSDDNFKISFVDFTDPNLGVTSYNLLLKIENNSDKTVIVSPSDGYANDEAVFLGSGMPVKVKPDKKVIGAFVVGYGNTSIQNIDEIRTLELNINLYDENFSEIILSTGNILINLE